LLLVLALGFRPQELRGEEPLKINPVKVSGGPLLLFKAGIQWAGDSLFAYDPQTHSRPQLLSGTAYTIRGFHRLGRQVLLLEEFDNLYLAHLKRGTIKPLLRGRRLIFLRAEGSTFFLLEKLNNSEEGRYWLQDNKKGDARIVKFPQPLLRLWALQAKTPPRPAVFQRMTFQRVLAVTRNWFWVIRGQPPVLWKIHKDGKRKGKVYEFAKGSVPPLFSWAFAPNRRLLAVGVARRDSFYKYRDLLVIDIRRCKLVFRLTRVPMTVSSFYSGIPYLKFTWLNNRRIRYSETKITDPGNQGLPPEGYFRWVDVDVVSRERLREKKYSTYLHLRHRKPPGEQKGAIAKKARRGPVGFFEKGGNRLYYRGSRQPVTASLGENNQWQTQDVAISLDGRWAAFTAIRTAKDGRHFFLYVADGKTKRIRRLSNKLQGSMTWLPRDPNRRGNRRTPRPPLGPGKGRCGLTDPGE
jgi:hypothetical protein